MSDKKNNDGKIVLYCLIAFFMTIAMVDSFFVYKAITTHRGAVEREHGR